MYFAYNDISKSQYENICCGLIISKLISPPTRPMDRIK